MSTTSPATYDVLGTTLTMPVMVRAAQQAAATFVVEYALAQRLIEHTGLVPQRLPLNKAMIAIPVVNYSDNDLGAYGELGLAVVVDSGDAPKGTVSTYIHRLPVDQEFTCAAGRQIWGFPKWVADLQVRFHSKGCEAVLRHDGQLVMRIALKRGPIPLPKKTVEMFAMTCDDEGIVRKTPWTQFGGKPMRVRPGGATIELGYGHPMADELRGLGLPKRALSVIFDSHMSASFGEAEIIS